MMEWLKKCVGVKRQGDSELLKGFLENQDLLQSILPSLGDKEVASLRAVDNNVRRETQDAFGKREKEMQQRSMRNIEAGFRTRSVNDPQYHKELEIAVQEGQTLFAKIIPPQDGGFPGDLDGPSDITFYRFSRIPGEERKLEVSNRLDYNEAEQVQDVYQGNTLQWHPASLGEIRSLSRSIGIDRQRGVER